MNAALMTAVAPVRALNVEPATLTVAVRDSRHLFEIAERHYKLLPLLMATLGNRKEAPSPRSLVAAAFARSIHGDQYVERTRQRESIHCGLEAVLVHTAPDGSLTAELRVPGMTTQGAVQLKALYDQINADPRCARGVDSLLAGYGYAGAPVCYTGRLEHDLKHAAPDGRFGDGFMANFAEDVVATLALYGPKPRSLTLKLL